MITYTLLLKSRYSRNIHTHLKQNKIKILDCRANVNKRTSSLTLLLWYWWWWWW